MKSAADHHRQGARSRRVLAAAAALGAAAVPSIACSVGQVAPPGQAAETTGDAEAPSTQLVAAQAGEEFFVPPDPLPAGEPGDVIRARPAAAGPPGAEALAEAWQVMYLSTDAMGEPLAVTGTVLVPEEADPAGAPVVGFGPGTHGPAFRCTPSRMIDSGTFYEQPAVNGMLEQGYAVAVTDYEGYHPDPDTTYMVGRSMGPALLDAVRAAQRLPEAGLSAGAPVVLRGYSQGGGAAMWAGQMQPDYAPELDLVTVAAGGVPANLAQVGLPLDGTDGYGFLLYALVGQSNAYPDLNLDDHLNEVGRAEVARMVNEDCTLELILDHAGGTLAENTATSPFTAAWLGRLAENQLGGAPIEVPVLQYHENGDGLVAPGQAQALRDDYCALGVDHTWAGYDTGGSTGLIRHINLVARANSDVESYVADRLAGVPTSPTC